MSESLLTNSTIRRAVLVFADSLSRDLARRGWSRKLSALLRVPTFDSRNIGTDVHVFQGGPTTGRAEEGEAPAEPWVKRNPARQEPGPPKPDAITHRQRGDSFGEKLSNAIEDLATAGYDQIVIVGRDCPQLTAEDIRAAFIGLSQSQVVLGPDHRGGCYLIALHASDRALLGGVRWRHNTDFAEIVSRAGVDRVICLPVKFDLDSMEDVRLLASHSTAWRWAIDLLSDTFDPPIRHLPHQRLKLRQRWQLPPPAARSVRRAA